MIDDYDETLDELERVAGSLKLVNNPKLARLGYRRINFKRHRYYFLYRVEGKQLLLMRCIMSFRIRIM